MALFFFDITDDGDFRGDTAGVELPDAHAARDHAAAVIGRLAADPLPRGDNRALLVRVRTEDGTRVLTVGLISTVRYDDRDMIRDEVPQSQPEPKDKL